MVPFAIADLFDLVSCQILHIWPQIYCISSVRREKNREGESLASQLVAFQENTFVQKNMLPSIIFIKLLYFFSCLNFGCLIVPF